MAEDKVTIGEVYRRLVDMDERYEAKLEGIDKQVRITNGRTTRLEEQVNRLNQEMRDIKHPQTPMALPVQVTNADGESLSITAKVSSKVWLGIVAAVSVLSPLVVEWLKSLMGKP